MKITKLPYLNPDQQTYLNTLGEKKPADCDKNYAVFRRWLNDVCTYLTQALLQIYSEDSVSETLSETQSIVLDAISMISSGLRKFDPKKGKLGYYINRALKMNYQRVFSDRFNDRGGMTKVPAENTDDVAADTSIKYNHSESDHEGETKTERPSKGVPEPATDSRTNSASKAPVVSISETATGTGASIDIPDNTPIDIHLTAALYLQQMTAMVLNFKQIYHGKSQNPERQKYFRMWFSERTKHLTMQGYQEIAYGDTLRALDYPYLDYFLVDDMADKTNHCWSSFVNAEPKKTIDTGVSTKPIVTVEWSKEGWLPAKIPRGYLGAVSGSVPSDSTVSEQRSSYLKELTALFKKNDLL